MALVWERKSIRSTSPLFSDAWSLASLPQDVTLKRIVLCWYIDMLGVDSQSLAFWAATPITNTLQITYGFPPPFPENPGITVPSNEDFLHYDMTTLKGINKDGSSVLLTSAFNDGSVGRWDTSVQRRTSIAPADVWWSWGVVFPGPYPPVGALSRCASSVLYETH